MNTLYLKWHWGCLPLRKELSSSSICQQKWCHLQFANQLRCLPFTLKLSSSSIYLKIEVVIHFAKNWGHHQFFQELKSRLKLNSAQQSWGLGWAWQYIVKDTKLYTENTEKITYSWFYKGSVNKQISAAKLLLKK